MSDILNILPNCDILTKEQAYRLNTAGLAVTHTSNEVIFKQNKPVSHLMFLKEGLVKTFREIKQDKQIIIKIFKPGEYINLVSLFGDNLNHSSATSLAESNLIYIELPAIREIIAENGKYASHFIKYLISEELDLTQKIVNQALKQVHGRIAEILIFFAKDIYQSENFVLPFSRQELADIAISTKESVSRTLTEFKNDKIIDINDKNIVIRSMELLEIINKVG